MTKRIGDRLVIESEAAQQCDYCGQVKELRPYGRDGAAICHACGTKPENIEETKRNFGKLLGGAAS